MGASQQGLKGEFTYPSPRVLSGWGHAQASLACNRSLHKSHRNHWGNGQHTLARHVTLSLWLEYQGVSQGIDQLYLQLCESEVWMNVEADTTSTGAWKRGEKNVYPKKSMKGNRMRERTSSISKPENVTALSLINGVMLDGQPNWRKTQQRPYINIKCLQIEKWTKVWNPNVHFLCLFYKERLLRYSLKLRCCKQISRRNL